MSVFTSKDVQKLFIRLACIAGVAVVLPQLYVRIFYGAFNGILLLFSLALSAGVLACCCGYFRGQQKIIDRAVSQIDRFMAGNLDARIESDSEGSLYKLFHAVNTLATTLNAHATREQNAKDFLRNTLSDISHQLKTPLAALTIYNSILLDEPENKEAVREFSLKSEKEIERIENLVQNLLKVTRLDAGSIVMERRTENIFDMMHDLKEHFETRAKREQKEISLSGAENIPLLCDRTWLTEAVSNLVKNALDHTQAGGRIQISWKHRPSVTQISVQDNGIGIHPEDIHHIFKRFYRSQFSKDTQGVGLGLPLAKAIVEAHGGNITVDSVLGVGSTFVMNFPVLAEDLTKL